MFILTINQLNLLYNLKQRGSYLINHVRGNLLHKHGNFSLQVFLHSLLLLSESQIYEFCEPEIRVSVEHYFEKVDWFWAPTNNAVTSSLLSKEATLSFPLILSLISPGVRNLRPKSKKLTEVILRVYIKRWKIEEYFRFKA